MSIFAAAVLGGLGSAPGAVLGAFLIGIAEELSVLVVGSQYRAAVGFVAILAVLSLRPRGLLGERAFLTRLVALERGRPGPLMITSGPGRPRSGRRC